MDGGRLLSVSRGDEDSGEDDFLDEHSRQRVRGWKETMDEAERLGKRGEVVLIRTPDGLLYVMNKSVTSLQSS